MWTYQTNAINPSTQFLVARRRLIGGRVLIQSKAKPTTIDSRIAGVAMSAARVACAILVALDALENLRSS